MTPKTFISVQPNPACAMAGIRFNEFTSDCGIEGLMRDNNAGMIELLAVATRTPGQGQFRRFIRRLKRQCRTICVWHVTNPGLRAALERYGFQIEQSIDGSGEPLPGLRWDRDLNQGAQPKQSCCNHVWEKIGQLERCFECDESRPLQPLQVSELDDEFKGCPHEISE